MELQGACEHIAALAHFSKAHGIGGNIKSIPEDFVVNEIAPNGSIITLDTELRYEEDGDFSIFVLEKKNWDTSGAIAAIAKKAGVSPKRFSFAGTKDRVAITTQLISAYKLTELPAIKDIKTRFIGQAKKKIEMGELLGNKFIIRITGADKNAEETVKKIWGELGGLIPNYFGIQRFGSVRGNTHLIGKHIVKNDFESAVLSYLTWVGSETNEEAVAARTMLAEKQDYKEALKNFPKHLKYERAMLTHLAKHPRDYVNAMRRIPRSIALMFVHAYQAYLFNLILSKRIKEGFEIEKGDLACGKNFYGFPDENVKGEDFILGNVIGYQSELTEAEKELLEEEGIKKEDFKIRSYPELSSKGTKRALLVPVKDFAFHGNTFLFSLPAGSYATSLLREFMDKKVNP
ncbi:MAG: tRNA pseudouridine(13) synthase TruD [Candidatus Micrarchaeia archaeon]